MIRSASRDAETAIPDGVRLKVKCGSSSRTLAPEGGTDRTDEPGIFPRTVARRTSRGEREDQGSRPPGKPLVTARWSGAWGR